MEEERGEWYLAKQIAAGILIAAAVMFVGIHLYAAVAVRVASKAAQELVQQSQQEMQEQLKRNAAQRRAQVEVQRVAKERKAAAELAQREEAARQAHLEQANAAAKQQAWRNFYKPSPECADPPDWDTQVECGNAHMRTQREFEARWASGDFR
jgi:hypothetical protein